MSQMVERVARAMATRAQSHTKWEDCAESFREQKRADARAAILAMRQPTGEMLIAGVACMAVFHDAPESDMSFPKLWDHVIDEALK